MPLEKSLTLVEKNRSFLLLQGLMAMLGLGALGGGGVLIISPSGALFGMPLSMLSNSPFKTFLIPGAILFVVLGLLPCILVIGLKKMPASTWAERLNVFNDMHWSWTFSIYVVFALIIWIQVEMTMLRAIHWLHTFYMFYAIAMLSAALLPSVRNRFKKS